MKQIIRFSFLLLAILLPASANAHDFYVNGIYYLKNGNEATVTYRGTSVSMNNNSYSGSVIIPETVTYNGTTYTVTAIGDDAFSDCHDLTSITIPNTVTAIGENAFYYCYSLTSVTIPNSVTTIGSGAFFRCYDLSSLTIGSGVTTIDEWTFYDCYSLTSITVAIGNTNYDSRNNCNAIIEKASNKLIRGCMNTVIPNSVATIGDYAFTNCHNLTSITIPNSVTSIGYWAFLNCNGLTSINIPYSVTSIGEPAFNHCSGLTSITVDSRNPIYDSRENCNAIIETFSDKLTTGCQNTVIPNSVTNIGYCAFEGCRGLINIDIPNSVTTIGNLAFNDCYYLTNITIPNSVTSIGREAFGYCYDLTSVTIGSGMMAIGAQAFMNCDALETVKCIGMVPPVMTSTDCFSTVAYNRATLLVPSDSETAYAVADYWYKFAHIDTFTLPTLNDALNCNGGNINFTSSGTYPWIVIDGGNRIYAQSGNGGVHNSSSTLTATVSTPQGGTLSFEFKAWGEGNEDGDYDLCIFNVDGDVKLYYADLQNNWVPYTTNLTPGTHTLTWTYSKDESVNPRGDYFAIDNVYLDLPVIRGDVNGDGAMTISDVTSLIDLLLSGGDIPANADVNGDGGVNIKDVTDLIDMLLSGN